MVGVVFSAWWFVLVSILTRIQKTTIGAHAANPLTDCYRLVAVSLSGHGISVWRLQCVF